MKKHVPVVLLLLVALTLGVAACGKQTGGTTTTASSSSSSAETAKTWTQLTATGTGPSLRAGQAMVYDATDDQVLVFGGTDSKLFYSDIWAYSLKTNAWTELKPAGDKPEARCALAMAYDSDTHKVVVFGGRGSLNAYGDTWVYDPAANTWTNASPTGAAPSARDGQSMVYDPVIKKMVLFGGKDPTGIVDDTWTYDVSANTWTQVQTPTKPTARDGQSMACDTSTGKVTVFGGWDGHTYFNSTWVYDPAANTWTSLTTTGDLPSVRAGQCMVYDATGKQLLVFGGTTGTTFLRDVLGLDPATNKWAILPTSAPWPSARNGHSLVYDSTNGAVLLFGGWDGHSYLNDLWVFAGRS